MPAPRQVSVFGAYEPHGLCSTHFLFVSVTDVVSSVLAVLLLRLVILFSLACSLPLLTLTLLSARFAFMKTLAFISAAVHTVWYFKPHLLQSFFFGL